MWRYRQLNPKHGNWRWTKFKMQVALCWKLLDNPPCNSAFKKKMVFTFSIIFIFPETRIKTEHFHRKLFISVKHDLDNKQTCLKCIIKNFNKNLDKLLINLDQSKIVIIFSKYWIKFFQNITYSDFYWPKFCWDQ